MTPAPRRVENLQTDKGSVPVYTTAVVEQPWHDYTAADHRTWSTLYTRQRALLEGRACEAFLQAQDAIGLDARAIPRFAALNQVLSGSTGWRLVGVEGLLPDRDFFEHLANRRFPVTWWLRRPEQIDYIAEPDLFHDLFGHVPLLMNPLFADYMQAYGHGALKAHRIDPEALQNLSRLYWYTVEFGLIDSPDGLRAYGAGIVSSAAETLHALESPLPQRLGFEPRRIMRTGYRIDDLQPSYFVIDGFEQLMAATAVDFTPIYAELAGQPALAADAMLDDDRRWSQTGAG